jgi:hypothetical protein
MGNRHLRRPASSPVLLRFDDNGTMRSWEECRYCWFQMSGEDLSRQMIMKIARDALNKLRHGLVVSNEWKELESYL